jgi:hypothetical protein
VFIVVFVDVCELFDGGVKKRAGFYTLDLEPDGKPGDITGYFWMIFFQLIGSTYKMERTMKMNIVACS